MNNESPSPGRSARVAEPSRVASLDGLRGLAMLMVLTFHCAMIPARTWVDKSFLFAASFGWSGVDIFFVLSGFLITGILLDSKGTPHYFRNFYARRTLRVFPLYYAVVAISFFVLPHLLPAAKLARWGNVTGDQAYYWLYLSNFSIARAGTFRHGVLDVSWSLAIEEQFYILWPTIVLWLSRRSLLRLSIVLMVVALATRLVLRLVLGQGPHDAYVLTPTRMDGLAAGAAVAVLARERGGIDALRAPARLVALVVTPLALFTQCWESWVLVDIATPGTTLPLGTVGFTFNAIFYAAVLVLLVTEPAGSRVTRFFRSRLLVAFGTYSYAMYLVHLPLRAVLRDLVFGPSWTGAPNKFPVILGSEIVGELIFLVLAGGIALTAGWLSYHLFEERFLKLKRFFPGTPALPARPAEAEPRAAA